MKKTGLFLAIIWLVVSVSGCSSQKEAVKNNSNPLEKASNYVPDMVDVNNEAQKDIADSVNQENQKVEEALKDDNNKENTMELTKKYTAASIKTNYGDIKVKFLAESAPKTVENFLKLAADKFYDGTKFHRVIKGFMIQGGDPNSKTANASSWGMGGPGYKFDDELKGTEKYPQGTLAMANSGPNTNGSQFFIVTASPEAPLPPSYTVFGQVVQGLDTALKIENVKTGPNDRPVENVVIEKVEVLEK